MCQAALLLKLRCHTPSCAEANAFSDRQAHNTPPADIGSIRLQQGRRKPRTPVQQLQPVLVPSVDLLS
eukprot:2439989-Amphidinium_carterae.1